MPAQIGCAHARTRRTDALLLRGRHRDPPRGLLRHRLLTPGNLGKQVLEQGNTNAAILLASALGSLGLIEFFAIFFTGAGWNGLDDAAVFGAVGVALQAVGFLVLDAVTPGKLGIICTQERFHPASIVSASVQIGVALIVCASLT